MRPAITILEYLDAEGRSPFGDWFGDLDTVAAAKVVVALTRFGAGNTSNVKGVGSGVFESRSTSAPATAFISARMARK